MYREWKEIELVWACTENGRKENWFGHVQRMEGNRIGLGMYREWKEIEFPPKILYMNLETMRLRGRPRNRWQDEAREDGRLVGGKGYITERNVKNS